MGRPGQTPLFARPAVRVALILLALLAVVVIGAVAWALPAPLPRLSPQLQARTPDVARGQYLATVGDCVACHTRPGGRRFAGGLPFKLPMGTIYSSNITADRQHGMGAYDLPEFVRLMRQGVGRDGRRIYPAMPYTSYAKVSDEDLQDIHAYFTRAVAPVAEPQRRASILWPLSIRWPVAFWDKLFLDDSRYRPQPARGPEWNRGAYLVQGLGHCGTCHTPRGPAINELASTDDGRRYLAGSRLDGQSPSNLRGDPATGLGRWSEGEIVELLRTARTAHYAVAGQMTEVVENSTQHMTEADLRAIAVYLKSLQPGGETARYAPSTATLDRIMAGQAQADVGARIYMDSCSACHRLNGEGQDHAFPTLAGNPTVMHPNPDSLVTAIVAGARLPSTQGQPSRLAMPAFGWRYDDAEIAALTNFLRTSWGNQAAPVTAKDVKRIRRTALATAKD